MILEKNLILNPLDSKPIVYDVCYMPTKSPKPVVIFCHGYKGFKDWGAWDLVAKSFAKAGFFFLKFNFSHNGGTVDQPIDFPDLEAFGQNNFSKELFDLTCIINLFSSKNDFKMEVNSDEISLVAHSRGAGIIIIKAEEEPKIKKVISWAGVSDFKSRFYEKTDVFKNWEKSGITYIENGRTKQQMPHYFQFYKDFIANEERLTIKRAAKNLNVPLLIIHGNKDKNVPIEEAESINEWSPKGILEIIKNADHVFGAKHPWEQNELPADLQKVVELSIKFLTN